MTDAIAPDSLGRDPNAECPGPGLIEALSAVRSAGSNYLELIARFQQSHGDFFRFRFGGSELYVLLNPIDIEKVLKTGRDRFPKNPLITREMKSLGPESVAVTGGERWKVHRRVTAPPFRPQALGGYGEVVGDALVALKERWETSASPFHRVDEDAADFTFRVLTRLMMGESLPDHERRIRGALELELECLTRRLASPIKMPHWAPTPNQIKLRRAQRELDQAAREIAELARDGASMGFAADWLRAYESIEPDPERAREIVRDQLMTVITAGHQTASFGLAYCLYVIARHPDVAERLRTESTRVLSGRVPSASDLAQMPYGARVVRETLRLYPVLPVVVRKVAEPFDVRGYRIPAGANLAISLWSAHRHADFWEDPERFDPGRFSPERSANRHPGAYLPFSAGPRSCLAGDFAFFELHSAVAYLSQFFHFAVDSRQPFRVVPKLALAPENGVALRIERISDAPLERLAPSRSDSSRIPWAVGREPTEVPEPRVDRPE